MPLGLSPYVTSTFVNQDAWPSCRVENDRPSPLRISKQLKTTNQLRDRDHEQVFARPPQDTAYPLQKQSANHLNVAKRRSLWALSSKAVQEEELQTVPPRPYSVGPNMALTAHFVSAPNEKSDAGPRTAEEAEDMLREASRTYSGASELSDSWNSFISGRYSARKPSGARSSSSVIRHVSSSTDGPGCTISMDSILPHVLSPHISIYTNSHGRYFGQDHIWAAVEVSGILSHAYSADGTGAKPAQPKEDEHHLVLILAQIRINPKSVARYANRAHRRHKSDELIADLENQLGDSQMAYMKVKVTYSHSAFSDYFGHEILVGVAQRCTRLETTAVGALKRHNIRSAWSPPPAYSVESIKSAMQKHWKADIVAEWMQRITHSGKGSNPERLQQGHNANRPIQQTMTQVPMQRPAVTMEDMCQVMTVNRISDSQNCLQSFESRAEKRGPCQVPNVGSVRSKGAPSRNTSGTTSTMGSLRKKKSFAAGIWRSLTPSINASKTDVDGSGQGPWNWNAWF
ncbi:hypothetical protein LLEC1_03695 [Akanthomyces lecanii]|uniref:Uncharacterized protein n=1 Tax=Cordyceps confragosa TaxID=2714763 RepID=A0A179ILD3_CORDF|nr:hypothetical protein LLEC1_03695 [Akanthomyces lecanii]